MSNIQRIEFMRDKKWDADGCRNFMYHLGIKPIKRVKKTKEHFIYTIAELEDKELNKSTSSKLDMSMYFFKE
tara:strand:+ start:5316 stop:5531 length:216 start_codon:yes stop_codon:yes gene_type:complete